MSDNIDNIVKDGDGNVTELPDEIKAAQAERLRRQQDFQSRISSFEKAYEERLRKRKGATEQASPAPAEDAPMAEGEPSTVAEVEEETVEVETPVAVVTELETFEETVQYKEQQVPIDEEEPVLAQSHQDIEYAEPYDAGFDEDVPEFDQPDDFPAYEEEERASREPVVISFEDIARNNARASEPAVESFDELRGEEPFDDMFDGADPEFDFDFDFDDLSDDDSGFLINGIPEDVEFTSQRGDGIDGEYEYVTIAEAAAPATSKLKDIIGEYFIFIVCVILAVMGIAIVNVGTKLPAFFIILAFAAIAALLIYAIYSAWKTKKKAELAYERGKAIYETVHRQMVTEGDDEEEEE